MGITCVTSGVTCVTNNTATTHKCKSLCSVVSAVAIPLYNFRYWKKNEITSDPCVLYMFGPWQSIKMHARILYQTQYHLDRDCIHCTQCDAECHGISISRSTIINANEHQCFVNDCNIDEMFQYIHTRSNSLKTSGSWHRLETFLYTRPPVVGGAPHSPIYVRLYHDTYLGHPTST